MRTLRFALLALLVVTIVAVPIHSTFAKGQTTKAVIKGPGLKDALEVTDTDALVPLSLGSLETFDVSLKELPALGEGYEITRYMQEPNAPEPMLFDHAHYFPSLNDEVGYIYFDGLAGNAWSEYDGNWYRATKSGDLAMRNLINRINKTKDSQPLTKQNLDQAPLSCKASAKLEKAPSDAALSVKVKDSVWVSGFQGQETALKIDSDSTKMTEHGWAIDLAWSARSNTKLLTIWGRNVEDNSQLWFGLPEQKPSAVLDLNPSLLKLKGDWASYQTQVFVPKAGCYEMSVYFQGLKTPTQFTFAAGS